MATNPYMTDVYGYKQSEVGKLGVPSSNDVLANAGHEPREWGEVYDGIGPSHPHLNQGVRDDEPLEGGGREASERLYGSDGTTKVWKGVPSSKAL